MLAYRSEILLRLVERNNFAVLHLQIEETGFVWAWRAITHSITHYDGHEAMLAAVHCACTYATTGGYTCNQHRIDAHRSQRRSQRCAKECARILLVDHEFINVRFKPVRECSEHGLGAAFKTSEGRDLAKENPAIHSARLVEHIGVNDGYAVRPAGSEQYRAGRARLLHVRIQWRFGDEICIDEIYYEQRRPGAELQRAAESAP